jgi:hypothetical protein
MQSVEDVINRIETEKPCNGELKNILHQFKISVITDADEHASDRAIFLFHSLQKKCREIRLKRKNELIDMCAKNGIMTLPKLFMVMMEHNNPKSAKIKEEFLDVFDIHDFLDSKQK